MSYLKVKNVSVDKAEKVCKVYCASNNVTPLYFGWTNYFNIKDLLPEIAGGSMQLYRSVQNNKINNLVYSYNKLFKEKFNIGAWELIHETRDVQKSKERCIEDLEDKTLNSYYKRQAKYWLEFLSNEENIKFIKEMEEKFVEEFLNLIKRGKKRTDK